MMLESPDLNEQFAGFLNLQQGQNERPNYCGIYKEHLVNILLVFFFLNCIEVFTLLFLMLGLDLMNWS